MSEQTKAELDGRENLIRASLTEGLAGFDKSVREAQQWLIYCVQGREYYQAWLANPDLLPPAWPFPVFTPREDTDG